tara:strand:- start:2028 stop:2432 length:405 start_codon:yes stop_codon:yes gene_type:complete
MSQLQQRRLLILTCSLLVIAGLVFWIMRSIGSQLNVYLTPSQAHERELPTEYRARIGGIVEPGSLVYIDKEQLKMSFFITDLQQHIQVEFAGVAPSLFKEGKGVIAEGQISNGVLMASRILAKHDENYKPPGIK